MIIHQVITDEAPSPRKLRPSLPSDLDTSGNVEAIGIDEIQWQKGHRYLTLVYQIDAGCRRLLWIGKDRTVSTLEGFFDLYGTKISDSLNFVCSDMWKPYLKAVGQRVGHAVHVLDRYHVMARMNKAIDEVRAAESKRLKLDGYEPVLKQTVKLSQLLKYDLQSVRAYLLREDFQRFWAYYQPGRAERFLGKWCTRTMRSKLEQMKKVARTLRNHQELLLNWFRAKGEISAGTVEGFNNNAKLTTRKAYRFRTYRAIEIALYHNLGQLPEPKLTHRFC